VAGRLIAPADDRPGADPIVVLSEQLWRRRFNADAGIVGRSLVLNGLSRTVVGVASAKVQRQLCCGAGRCLDAARHVVSRTGRRLASRSHAPAPADDRSASSWSIGGPGAGSNPVPDHGVC
jgi:hypothetical protein